MSVWEGLIFSPKRLSATVQELSEQPLKEKNQLNTDGDAESQRACSLSKHDTFPPSIHLVIKTRKRSSVAHCTQPNMLPNIYQNHL